MKVHRIVIALALLVGAAAAAPQPAVAQPQERNGALVRVWTELALESVARSGTNDAGAARAYAMVEVAMYDAVNALLPKKERHTAVIVSPGSKAKGDPGVAAAKAAHDVLCALYPARKAIFDDALDAQVDLNHPSGATRKGLEWGGIVAAGVVGARAQDGLTGTETQAGSNEIGQFNQPWNSQPRHLAPFVIADPSQYLGDGPPPLDSAAYAAAFNDVKFLGDKQRVDPAADATSAFWSLGGGTEQPPGAWLRVASATSTSHSLSLSDTARLFALTAIAMADTVAPTYSTKAHHHFWRPIEAIRRAADDGNAATDPAPTWNHRGAASGSPENWSGHSAFSGAAATVLADFFGTDQVAFTLVTLNGLSRSFSSFSQAEEQAGLSRVLGGLHFSFSNTQGLDAGRAIAQEVLQTALQPVKHH